MMDSTVEYTIDGLLDLLNKERGENTVLRQERDAWKKDAQWAAMIISHARLHFTTYTCDRVTRICNGELPWERKSGSCL